MSAKRVLETIGISAQKNFDRLQKLGIVSI